MAKSSEPILYIKEEIRAIKKEDFEMQKLDMRQINNLMTGNSLATEISSSSEE